MKEQIKEIKILGFPIWKSVKTEFYSRRYFCKQKIYESVKIDKVLETFSKELSSISNSMEFIKNKILLCETSGANLYELQQQIRKLKSCAVNSFSIAETHKKTFLPYRNFNSGKEAVLLATGPSLDDFKPIKNAVYAGVNGAFRYKKVNLDFYFTKHPHPGFENWALNEGKDIAKFYGKIIGNFAHTGNNYSFQSRANAHIYAASHNNAKVFYQIFAEPEPENKEDHIFTYDIDSQVLVSCYSIVFAAMQFLLWTNPSKIYIAGADCCPQTARKHFSDSKDDDLKPETPNETFQWSVPRVIGGWQKMKMFAEHFYPNTQIISINPIGLKGLFKDIYTESYAEKNLSDEERKTADIY
ncbi:MAG: hypothetical protein LBH29_04465 [Elusimicrobiota bacterium]|jgi:hypothetical protein|nr:hypothetical protein [Elusimicrobiota bacterium]